MKPLSAELLARHGAPTPRYTSYPTVAQWHSPPSTARWLADLDAALTDGAQQGLSLYVHVPFCAALCTFCGCHMRVVRNHALARPYVDTLLREFALYRERLGRDRLPLGELHLGGGTPNFLPPGELDRLLGGLLGAAEVRADASLAIEADPRLVTHEQLGVLRRHGINRISYGVQDLDPRVLEIVNRLTTPAQVQDAVDGARAAGIATVSFDLIYGLPLQTQESLRLTMDAVEQLRPEQIAFYPYAHVPWIKPSQRQFTEADLPEGEDRRRLYLYGRERLAAMGHVEIGMDQFALPENALARAARAGRLHRNFMGYTPVATRALLGLGVSAMSDTRASLAQNEKSQQRHELRVAAGELPLQRGHVLDEQDRRRRDHIFALLTRYQTHWSGEDAGLRAEVEPRLSGLVADGLIESTPALLGVTETGRAFLRSICAAFDAHLQAADGSLAA